MSFFSDPELYLVWGRTMGLKFHVFKIQAEFGSPLTSKYFHTHEVLKFSEHLSLPHNKESDFDGLFAYLTRNDKYVNCKGHVIDWLAPNNQSRSFTYTWSHELLNLPSYGVHASPQQGNESVAKVDRASINNDPDREKADKLEALEKKVSDLLEQLDREKNDKQALEKRVSDLTEQFNQDKKALEKQVNELTLKLEECCGGAKGGSADE
ncbi:hypothetical protein MKW92_002383 [Papaver armeniacum]|nr:hypothetical protein MKW92_002383 [Papaver armeniacum]